MQGKDASQIVISGASGGLEEQEKRGMEWVSKENINLINL